MYFLKCFERSNGLDTALYKNIHFFFTNCVCVQINGMFVRMYSIYHCNGPVMFSMIHEKGMFC